MTNKDMYMDMLDQLSAECWDALINRDEHEFTKTFDMGYVDEDFLRGMTYAIVNRYVELGYQIKGKYFDHYIEFKVTIGQESNFDLAAFYR